MFYDIIFWVLVLSVCIDAFRFHRFRPFREVFTPFYAIAMCVYTVYQSWTDRDWALLIAAAAIGLLIGSLQAVKSEIQFRSKDETKKPHPYVRDHFPYVLGWLLLVGFGVLFYLLLHRLLPNSAEELHSVASTVFQSSQPWYMWAMYGSAGLTYYLDVDRKIRRLAESES